MKKSLILLVAALLVRTATAQVFGVNIPTNVVLNAFDQGYGSLRDVIEHLAPGDTIRFAPGVTGTIFMTEILIAKSLTIEGPGASKLTLGGVNSRLFRVNAGVVHLSGLRFAQGRVVGSDGIDGLGVGWNGESGQAAEGGAILNRADLTISNCMFSGNVALGGNGGNGIGDARFLPAGHGGDGGGGSGGAIANHGMLTIQNCAFIGNSCGGGDGGDGGTGYNYGLGGRGGTGGAGWGAAIFNDGTLIAAQCAFFRNGVAGGSGGRGADGTRYGGGGGPGAHGQGGAIADVGQFTVMNCMFSENAIYGGYRGDAGDGNSGSYPGGGKGGGAFGGALDLRGAGALIHCTVAHNWVSSGAGGLAPDPGFNGGQGTNAGGGIHTVNEGVLAMNTVLALNAMGNEPGTGPDAAGPFASLGHNFIGIANGSTGWQPGDHAGSMAVPLDPRLGPLQGIGGLFLALVPLRGSPLLDAGDDSVLGSSVNLAIDQRGGPRRGFNHVDIGAVEVGSALRLTELRRLGPSATDVSFRTESGFLHRLESKDALGLGPWTPVGPLALVGNGGVMTVRDNRAASSTKRFYRAVMNP